MSSIDPGDAGARPEFTLGDRLRKAREVSGLEQQQLAAAIDIHRQSVARYERGDAIPKWHVLLAWSDATRVDLGWITERNPATHVEESTRSIDLEYSTDSVDLFRVFPRVSNLIKTIID